MEVEMNIKFIPIIVLCLVAISFNAAFAEPNMNPGKWEITTQTEMEDMPGMIPAVTHTQCIERDDPVPQSKEASEDCEIVDMMQDGNAITWRIVCSGKDGEMEGTGKVSYNGDSMNGTMDMVVKGAGMRIRNTISGKRVGECD
jgi:hypothetical protein